MTRNKLRDFIKFIVVFVVFLGITIPTYLFIVPSVAQERINKIDYDKCIQQDKQTEYQSCLRRDIIQIISVARPIDVTTIEEFIYSLYERDLKNSSSNEEQSIAALLYLENMAIYFNNMREISIARNNITFLDVFFIGKTREDLSKRYKKFMSLLHEIDFRALPTDIAYRKDMAMKLLSKFESN
ncbi:hypothetical protein M902_2055 [Bacteriovorax sp. BAL6_X]|uniref:hypothetical protein n=1 Tax=Bacteriovorax sp. BAL6_X TaxID=1201290 RepID=UPI000386D91F|nr:hypothetical protein [Bacteriovorax sp. BAL6_X]EPZ52072.1 hypothetical protein M902_2055 [Bacteriovorax sp. BAL6_X]